MWSLGAHGPGGCNRNTPQGGRKPTGLSIHNPAMSTPAPSQRDLWVGNPEQGVSGLQSHRPRGPKPEAPTPTAAPKVVEVPAMQPAVWIHGRWSYLECEYKSGRHH